MSAVSAYDDVVKSLFDQRVEYYLNDDREGLIAMHYNKPGHTLFWASEGSDIRNRQDLRLWYESAMGDYRMTMVSYRLVSVAADKSGELLAVASIWRFEAQHRQDQSINALDLRTTHVLERDGEQWHVSHLHASPLKSAD